MLIFDSFPNRQKAEAFVNYIHLEYSRKAWVFDSQEESNKVDIFPFKLNPPIVLVERLENYGGEEEFRQLVDTFEGVFAGT